MNEASTVAGESLEDLRAQIDRCDLEIARAFARRFFLSGQAQDLKDAAGKPIKDNERERAILAFYERAGTDNCPAPSLGDLAQKILNLCKSA